MSDEKSEVQMAGIRERDIDSLLLEEFVVSPEFGVWFCQQIGFPKDGGIRITKVELSATDANGESDLEVTLREADGGDQRILIENKIAAPLQPNQVERYGMRGESYLRRGLCVSFRTVLVAPDCYGGGLESTKGFDVRVSYEAILNWFDTLGQESPRVSHKKRLLVQAIKKAEKKASEENETVTKFWKNYWTLACEKAPELKMDEPTGKATLSNFVLFKPDGLPQQNIMRFVHKAHSGRVDLEFKGKGCRIGEIVAEYGVHLREDMEIVKAMKSAAIRLKVQRINMTDDFEKTNKDKVAEGIEAAKSLWKWYCGIPESRL